MSSIYDIYAYIHDYCIKYIVCGILAPVSKLARKAALILAFVLFMFPTGCAGGGTDIEEASNDLPAPVDSAIIESESITYSYPKNPAENLKEALEIGINKLPPGTLISEVRQVDFDDEARKEITVDFTDDDNTCVISFAIRALSYNLDYSIDGHDNPSFTMAFKKPDVSENMTTLLTLVLRYLEPELSLAEAERIAAAQAGTISEDGYSISSQPRDISGYQIRTCFTDPEVFFRTRAFDSFMGVKITALAQIWGDIDIHDAGELVNAVDYGILDQASRTGRNALDKLVYADFTVTNIWEHEEDLHGDTWETIEVETAAGQTYTLRYDTVWGFIYNFGVGQRYTIYMIANAYHGPTIVYAVQLPL